MRYTTGSVRTTPGPPPDLPRPCGAGASISARDRPAAIRGLRSRYRHTTNTVKHRQGLDRAARAGAGPANLAERAEAGPLDLLLQDERSLSHSLPRGYGW
jgi:hypothetical protein